jgi:peptidoglycan/xylan/chitin deacetylase (PgdA/CDA1 family)
VSGTGKTAMGNRDLTIIMYHYVRPLARSRYPAIKGLDVSGFRAQLAFLAGNYQPVTMEEVIHAIGTNAPLPPKALLLTFDDGYLDHYLHAFPLLHDMGIQGSFFAPVAPVRDRELLDVNRIHFILAAANDTARLRVEIDEYVRQNQKEFDLLSADAYWAKYAQASRFDTAEVIYIKRMLQVALPEKLRNKIAGELFAQYVSCDEVAFAAELYMDTAQLSLMRRSGMFVGSHGTSHSFMDAIDRDRQIAEVEESLGFLREIGSDVGAGWAMCYPFGAWNESLLEILRDRNCSVGLTTEVGVANLDRNDSLLLPRLDTNDLRAAIQSA